MKITFLGTGTSQGVPVIGCSCRICQSEDPRDTRLRSSIMIETGGKRIVVDCGPDFRQQMLREKVSSIDAILITHGHKDHLGGLDDVRAFNYFLQRPTDVYAAREVQETIRMEFSYAFSDEKYPGVPEIRLHTVSNRRFKAADVDITPVRARHYNEHFVFGYRIGDFTYITDASEISEKEKKKIAGSRVIVLNALRIKKHYSHFNLEEAIALMGEFKPERGYLTHISHQMGLTEEMSTELPEFIEFAYDGLKTEL